MNTSVSDLEFAEYELMVILPPDLKENDLNQRLNDLRSALTEDGGKILHEELVGLRDFAYRIGKYENGVYAVFHFQQTAEKVPELERTIRIESGVVRHLLLRTPKNYFFKTLKEYFAEDEAAALKEDQEKKAQEAEKKKPVRRRMPEAPEKPEMPEKVSKSEALKSEAQKSEPLSEDQLREKLKEEEKKLESLLDNPDIQI